MRRLINAVLLLYPRAVRADHGAELGSLVEQLIERDGASPPVVISRLAADGLLQRMTSRTTGWVVAVTLALTSFGGLAVSDFAAASAHQARPTSTTRMVPAAPLRVHTTAPRPHRISRRSAEIITR